MKNRIFFVAIICAFFFQANDAAGKTLHGIFDSDRIINPLIKASADGDIDTVKTLLSDGENVNERTTNGVTPLEMASFHGHADVARVLIDHGASINATDSFDLTSMYWAAEAGNKEVVELLFNEGADVITPEGYHAINVAANNGWYDVVKFFIDADINLNISETKGTTPLCHAASGSYLDIVNLLIDAGADVNADLGNGKNLIGCIGVARGRFCFRMTEPEYIENAKEILNIFLKMGADINWKDSAGQTPLHWHANNELIKYIVPLSPNINVTDNYNRTPLSIAVKYGIMDIIEFLVSNGADVNVKDNSGDTPLITVIEGRSREDFEIVELLLKHGADISVANKTGRLPLELAEDYGKNEIANLIRTYQQ